MNTRYRTSNVFKNSNLLIEERHLNEVDEIIKNINYRRLRIIGLTSTFMEIVLKFMLPQSLIMNFDKFSSTKYDFLHSLMLLWGIIVLIISSFRFKAPKYKFYDYFPSIAVFVFMIIIMFIGILDQYNLGKITSYITILFVLGVTVLIKPPLNYFVFFIPHLIFLSILITKFPLNNSIISSIINSSIFLVSILLTSRIFYQTLSIQLLNNIILEETNEKMDKIINTDSLTTLPNRRSFEETIKIIINEVS